MTLTVFESSLDVVQAARQAKERAAYVEALRTIADLIEGDTSLPVPFSGRLQAGFYEHVKNDDGTSRPPTEAEKFARLRRFADTLGVDVVEDHNRNRTATLAVGPISYFAHANADPTAPTYSSRVVPAGEDTSGGER